MKSRALLWFIAFRLMTGRQASALPPQSFTCTLGTILGTQACAGQEAHGRGVIIVFIAIIVPVTEILLCTGHLQPSPMTSNLTPTHETRRERWLAWVH